MTLELSGQIAIEILNKMGINHDNVYSMTISLSVDSPPTVHISRLAQKEELGGDLWERLARDPELIVVDESYEPGMIPVAQELTKE